MARVKVGVESFQGRLRLRWSYQKKRVVLTLGMDDTPTGRVIAEGRAAIIAADLAVGTYDSTLDRYRTQEIQNSGRRGSITDLFDRFCSHRFKAIGENSRTKYKALKAHIQDFFGDQQVLMVTEDSADWFREYLGQRLRPTSVSSYVSLMKGCWRWGAKRGLADRDENPWEEVAHRIKVPHERGTRPFTHTEVQAILEGFRTSRHYSHFTDFVFFLFGTGCRLGEAVALQWQHLGEDCTKVWIGESVSNGRRGPTKTNTSREFRLSEKQRQMLLNRKPSKPDPAGLVFPSPRSDRPIDIRNFRNRAWKNVLNSVNVPYRRPYICRSTFISHALEAGTKPMAIAQITGHDPETLFKFYASSLSDCNQIPDVL